jgi:hypothetical protein
MFFLAVSLPFAIIASRCFLMASFFACISAFIAVCHSAHSAIIRRSIYPLQVTFVSASSSVTWRAVGTQKSLEMVTNGWYSSPLSSLDKSYSSLLY